MTDNRIFWYCFVLHVCVRFLLVVQWLMADLGAESTAATSVPSPPHFFSLFLPPSPLRFPCLLETPPLPSPISLALPSFFLLRLSPANGSAEPRRTMHCWRLWLARIGYVWWQQVQNLSHSHMYLKCTINYCPMPISPCKILCRLAGKSSCPPLPLDPSVVVITFRRVKRFLLACRCWCKFLAI